MSASELTSKGLPFRKRGYYEVAPSTTPLHLRRICGACPHFTGRRLRDVAKCSRHGVSRDGTNAGCDDWSRKNAEGPK